MLPSGLGLANTYAVDPNYRIGYAQIWQLSVQNDLGKSLVGTITHRWRRQKRIVALARGKFKKVGDRRASKGVPKSTPVRLFP